MRPLQKFKLDLEMCGLRFFAQSGGLGGTGGRGGRRRHTRKEISLKNYFLITDEGCENKNNSTILNFKKSTILLFIRVIFISKKF